MSVNNRWVMPEESEPHKRTWMSFGASKKIWGNQLYPKVQENLATIANTIARYEPVTMLVRAKEVEIARTLLSDNVQLVEFDMDDLWIRDTGCIFVHNENVDKAGIDFNFNGWGNKQAHKKDALVAEDMTRRAEVRYIRSKLVLEGGGIEVDGLGTAIITESCVLNNNRNPGISKRQCERELRQLLGINKVIWLPGISGYDITDGHTDFYARFTGDGIVVVAYDPDPLSFDHEVTKEHIKILKKEHDVLGRPLQLVELRTPSNIRPDFSNDDFAAGYINFYVCNGAVIMPEFGDADADKKALDTLVQLYPGREIIQLNIDAIAAGGGGIHCTTQQQSL